MAKIFFQVCVHFSWICLAISSDASKPPNIVILLADDMGWNDIGIHGSEIPTPNLDALAYNGIVLKRHYAQPSCTPSRAALLTGQYPIRYGLHGYPLQSTSKDGLPTNITIMPQVLKSLGYRTNLVGKWHQGYSTWAHMPTSRGFDSFFGYLNGFLSYYDGVHYNPLAKHFRPFGHHQGFIAPLQGIHGHRCNEEESWRSVYAKYLPEVLSEKAGDVIRDHSQNHSSQPLFMLVATNAPHAGGNRVFSKEVPPRRSNATEFITNPTRRIIADVMRYVDDTMGNIVSTLKSTGMLDDTIVIFMGDNGGPTIDNGEPDGYANSASNYPLRGMKLSMFEGGVRAPAILWKSGLNSSSLKVYENLFHITDWLPTIVTAIDGKINLTGLDGVDHWAAMTGKNSTAPRNDLLVEIQEAQDSYGYIKDNFKLVKGYSKNYSRVYCDTLFSSPPELNPKGYLIQAVRTSAVSTALGVDLNETDCQRLRSLLKIQQSCTGEDQSKAALQDCSTEGCLFDLTSDPSECFDVSEQNVDVKKRLIETMKEYKAVMVKRRVLNQDNQPNERNYFAPSSALSLHNSSPAILFLVVLTRLFAAA